MDPISLIVAAVAAGAAAGLKDTATAAVKDAYGALKRLLTERHAVDVGAVERKPDSEAKRASLQEDLGDAGAASDHDVLLAAQLVIEEVKRSDAAAARAVGVDLDDVSAAFVRIADVRVRGDAVGVDLDRVRASGGIDISGIDVQEQTDRP